MSMTLKARLFSLERDPRFKLREEHLTFLKIKNRKVISKGNTRSSRDI